jgi:hypothetical protein
MMRLISSCVAVAVLVGPAAATMGQDSRQDYPQWRGTHRDGAASAFSKPESWPEHLKLRRRVEVGAGYATPIVVGKTVYAFTRRDGKEGMTALDAETGDTIWRTDYPVSYEMYEGTLTPARSKATPLHISINAGLGDLEPRASQRKTRAVRMPGGLRHRYNRPLALPLHRSGTATSSLLKLMAITR